MSLQNLIYNLSFPIKLVLGLVLGIIFYIAFRYFIYVANKSYKKEMQGKRKPTQLERLKVLAEN
jgi:hypothetical protein